MSGSDWDARISRFSAVLFGICALAIGFGLLMPPIAAPDPDAEAPAGGYRPLAVPAAPVRLVVPSLKIRAPVLPIEVNDQQILDPPDNPRNVGWWKRSARPGAAKGQTVLTGHTVHTGGGVMDHLGDLHKGQVVKVVTPQGTMEYTTTKVITWSKTELAERAVEIFAQQRSDTRLVLITCTDWTGSTYKSNIVVFAKPLGVREKAA